MILQKLTIDNFKNIARARLELSPKINGFLGDNGMGKSNLLDAVYFLSFCKSFTGVSDSLITRRDEIFCMLKGEYIRRGTPEELTVGMGTGHRKSVKRRGKEYIRLSEHIGTFPLVLVSPADIDLIRGSGDERRRFMDMVISQGDRRYLDELIRYNHAVEQRNRMLKDGCTDSGLFAAVEMPMARSAAYLHNARASWTEELAKLFAEAYASIAGNGELPELSYQSQLNAPGTDMMSLLEERRQRDIAVKYTTGGPHRDDIDLQLSGMPMRRTASQGQCKTFTIALRLAQYEFLRRATGLRPLLLLDDIFDKLDASRVERIITVVGRPEFGQIFITDTNRTHLDEIMTRTGGDYSLWSVTDGQFEPIPHDAGQNTNGL